MSLDYAPPRDVSLWPERRTMNTETMKHPITKNILLVEDDLVTTFITESLLKQHYNIKSVSTGYAALKEMEEGKYDLVLMDINLGDINMDGIKTMRMIRNNPKHKQVRIIAVTAYSDNRKWFIEQGFNELIIKPLVEGMLPILEKHLQPLHLLKAFSMN
jgi:CheY-like chemotaxis protein